MRPAPLILLGLLMFGAGLLIPDDGRPPLTPLEALSWALCLVGAVLVGWNLGRASVR